MSVSDRIRLLEAQSNQVPKPSATRPSLTLLTGPGPYPGSEDSSPNLRTSGLSLDASSRESSPLQHGQGFNTVNPTNGLLTQPIKKERPPLASKSTSVTQKLNALQVGQITRPNLAAIARVKSTNNPPAEVDERAPIILVDNELLERPESDASPSATSTESDGLTLPTTTAGEDSDQPREGENALQGFTRHAGRFARKLSDNAQGALSKRTSRSPVSNQGIETGTIRKADNDQGEKPKDPLQNFRQQANQLTRKWSDNAQDIVAARPLKPPKPHQIGAKLSKTIDPLLRDAKTGGEKIREATKPAREQAGQGFAQAAARTKETLDSMGVSAAFLATQDDIADAKSKIRGKDGVCSKCRRLPMDRYIYGYAQTQEPSVEWATPLSRLIYHAEWCRVCSLILDKLCEPENDPLQHHAVAPHLQDEIKGQCMREWVANGWEFTDQYWPFGHGTKRHEGATYVLGPGREALGWFVTRSVQFAVRYGLQASFNPRSDNRSRLLGASQGHRRSGEGSQSQHPLSCVVKISTETGSSFSKAGMMFLTLLGYGRKLGADLQILSSFRLRAVSTTPSSEINCADTGSLDAVNGFSYGALLDPNWVNPSIGSLWLRECETTHGSECNQHGWALAMQKPKFLRVIDVQDLCVMIVRNPEECRFVALSYVWGGADMVKLKYDNIAELMKPKALLKYADAIPKTITDTIEVVREMGERFLWVDALCILQGDALEASENIGSMDRVYGNAIVTIVAGQGETASAGLGGVRPKCFPEVKPAEQRILHQKSAMVKESTALVAPLATKDHGLELSAWNTRAWTFQERMISRRLIIFTHGQVVWHCRRMICREDMTVEDSGVPYRPLQWLSLKPRHLGVDTGRNWRDGAVETTRHGVMRIVRSATFVEYVKMIEQYTHREMTYQSDALNAFAGLLHIFSLCFKCSMFFGLPESLLDIALLWRPTQQLERRNAFPSWSWAGWVGSVAYDEPFKIKRSPDGGFLSFTKDPRGEEGIKPLIRWHKLGSYNNAAPINGDGVGVPLEGATLPPEWENGPYCVDDRGSGGTMGPPAIFVDKGLRGINNLSQCLIFWTSSTSKLYLGQSISQQSDKAVNPNRPPRRYRIKDVDTYVVGTVLLDSADEKWMASGRHEFIQIAEAHYYGLDDEVRDIEDCPLYVVMLIEWDKNFQVAYRRGLGRVQKTAWMLAAPKLKLVYLG